MEKRDNTYCVRLRSRQYTSLKQTHKCGLQCHKHTSRRITRSTGGKGGEQGTRGRWRKVFNFPSFTAEHQESHLKSMNQTEINTVLPTESPGLSRWGCGGHKLLPHGSAPGVGGSAPARHVQRSRSDFFTTFRCYHVHHIRRSTSRDRTPLRLQPSRGD